MSALLVGYARFDARSGPHGAARRVGGARRDRRAHLCRPRPDRNRSRPAGSTRSACRVSTATRWWSRSSTGWHGRCPMPATTAKTSRRARSSSASADCRGRKGTLSSCIAPGTTAPASSATCSGLVPHWDAFWLSRRPTAERPLGRPTLERGLGGVDACGGSDGPLQSVMSGSAPHGPGPAVLAVGNPCGHAPGLPGASSFRQRPGLRPQRARSRRVRRPTSSGGLQTTRFGGDGPRWPLRRPSRELFSERPTPAARRLRPHRPRPTSACRRRVGGSSRSSLGQHGGDRPLSHRR